MGRKKEDGEAAKVDIFKEIEKKYGINVVQSGDEFLAKPKQIIPVSPAMDLALGGIPEGSWWVVSGPPKYGKTTLALSFCANAQLEEYGSRMINFFNIEGRLKEMNLKGIEGLKSDPEHFRIIGSTEDKILSAEHYLQIAEDMMMATKNQIWLFDSFSCLVHPKEQAEGIGTSTRGGGAMLLAQFCRQMSNIIPVKNHIVIGVSHLMANTGGSYGGYTEKDGNAIKYQVDVKTRARAVESIKSGDVVIGQKVKWEIDCTATGRPPDQVVWSMIRYGKGIDRVAELIELGKTVGLIEEKGGGWTIFVFMAEHLDMLGVSQWDDEAIKLCRAQGAENAYNMLMAHPEWMKILQRKLNEMLCS